MKQEKSSLLGLLDILGLSPFVLGVIFLGIFVSGLTLGLLLKKPTKAIPVPAVVEEIVVLDVESSPIPLVKAEKPVAKTPFEKYSLAVAQADTPVIAIIIDDMGVDMIRSQKILDMDQPLTVSYLTYAPGLQGQINKARESGKEVMLHIPMEAANRHFDYGGPYLSTDAGASENLSRLRKMLDKVNGYMGVNNHMGSKFTKSKSQMEHIVSELGRRGLAFVDSKTAPNTPSAGLARAAGVPFAERDYFLDDNNDIAAIRAELAKLEGMARRRGYAVAIGHPRENTIKALKEWIPLLAEKKLTVVPVSYVIKIDR